MDDRQIASKLKPMLESISARALFRVVDESELADPVRLILKFLAIVKVIQEEPSLALFLEAPSQSRERRRREFAAKYSLNESDMQTLDLVCQGKEDREIARALHLSPETIHGRVKKLLFNAQSKTRTELTCKAFQAGLYPTH